MQFHLSFHLLCIVVLQQILSVTSIVSFEQNPNNKMMRSSVTRALRGPLMGRSITTILNDSKDHPASDEKVLIQLDKRLYDWILSGRPRWMGANRRGPLLG